MLVKASASVFERTRGRYVRFDGIMAEQSSVDSVVVCGWAAADELDTDIIRRGEHCSGDAVAELCGERQEGKGFSVGFMGALVKVLASGAILELSILVVS